ncbi:cytochrome c oxidase assembly protein [Cryobacterium zhongshanensis]|uniref:Bifunctional copper resistance protein CopD/cytochrome c oxidase assembly protein n=1 Tax=Cryobacterium zhongshanensis TaxID=2928153 RepID=A0AA41UHI1_9MICO|nr:cytochrome c oxidase assembly protein [Cryobacterium zhongshanensis]MCI4658464.1 bifunctional copper resistance protein CopD/cytochrome c oxidase assembly protein [Cryobacterium zhongshanensis]
MMGPIAVSTRAQLPDLRVLAPAVVLAVAVFATIVVTLITAPAQPSLVTNAGPLILYGLPILKVLTNLATAGTLGALVLACFAIAPASPAYGKSIDIAGGCAAAWAVTAAGCAVLTFMSIAGQVSPALFMRALAQFLGDIGLGQAWLATILLSATISVLCFAVRSLPGVTAVALLAFATLVPLALQGHAAGSGDHSAASAALWLHLAAAGTWIGGLAVIAGIHRTINRGALVTLLSRYSTIALLCFVTLTASGTISAFFRFEHLGQLFSTTYGLVLTAKIVALIGLGLAGFAHRNWLLGRLRGTVSARWVPLFWWLVISEMVLMGVASGAAVVLARTPPPATEPIARSTSELLTGLPLPAPLTWPRVFDSWSIDVVWLLVAGFGIFFYLAGLYRLRQRGDEWPVLRTASWIAGLLLLVYVTSGAPNIYGPYLVSVNLLGQFTLVMIVPLLLVPGAPFTLALRAIRSRADGSRGGREWADIIVRSRLVRAITHPLVAAGLLAGSLLAIYYTPVLEWTLIDPVGQQWLTAHLLIVGFLFAQSFFGMRPVPERRSYLVPALTLLAAMVFHAFFGLSLIFATQLLLPDWFGVLGSDWGIDPLVDQQLAGGIAWGVGAMSTLVLAVTVGIFWYRARRSLDRNPGSSDADLPAVTSAEPGRR